MRGVLWEVILKLCLLGENTWPRKKAEKGVPRWVRRGRWAQRKHCWSCSPGHLQAPAGNQNRQMEEQSLPKSLCRFRVGLAPEELSVKAPGSPHRACPQHNSFGDQKEVDWCSQLVWVIAVVIIFKISKQTKETSKELPGWLKGNKTFRRPQEKMSKGRSLVSQRWLAGFPGCHFSVSSSLKCKGWAWAAGQGECTHRAWGLSTRSSTTQ